MLTPTPLIHLNTTAASGGGPAPSPPLETQDPAPGSPGDGGAGRLAFYTGDLHEAQKTQALFSLLRGSRLLGKSIYDVDRLTWNLRVNLYTLSSDGLFGGGLAIRIFRTGALSELRARLRYVSSGTIVPSSDDGLGNVANNTAAWAWYRPPIATPSTEEFDLEVYSSTNMRNLAVWALPRRWPTQYVFFDTIQGGAPLISTNHATKNHAMRDG